jgi:hypothetical protein
MTVFSRRLSELTDMHYLITQDVVVLWNFGVDIEWTPTYQQLSAVTTSFSSFSWQDQHHSLDKNNIDLLVRTVILIQRCQRNDATLTLATAIQIIHIGTPQRHKDTQYSHTAQMGPGAWLTAYPIYVVLR